MKGKLKGRKQVTYNRKVVRIERKYKSMKHIKRPIETIIKEQIEKVKKVNTDKK